MTNIRICLAGATGWAGSALARGIFEAPDLELVAVISRSHAGQVLGDVLGVKELAAPVFTTVAEALATRPDVFVEYTKPNVAKSHIVSALQSGAHVVVGTSGLSTDDYHSPSLILRWMQLMAPEKAGEQDWMVPKSIPCDCRDTSFRWMRFLECPTRSYSCATSRVQAPNRMLAGRSWQSERLAI